ncbi:MAG: hypothetical protein GEV04_22645 [Actinophytocola sp.]|nr:hypothetical protein [Actinophytocola sp.]
MESGADCPEQLVGVPAGELFDWAWLTIELADWLAHASPATQRDFAEHTLGTRTTERTAVFCEHISERMSALLDGRRGQP